MVYGYGTEADDKESNMKSSGVMDPSAHDNSSINGLLAQHSTLLGQLMKAISVMEETLSPVLREIGVDGDSGTKAEGPYASLSPLARELYEMNAQLENQVRNLHEIRARVNLNG